MLQLSIIPRLSSLTGLFSLASGSLSLSSPFYPPPTVIYLFISSTAWKPQGRAVGSGWNLLSVYRVYPRNSPWVTVMAILIIPTGCKCGCPGKFESASHSLASVTAWGKWSLLTFFCNLCAKKSTQKFSYENPGLQIFYQKLHLEWEKDSVRAERVTGSIGQIGHFCITALLLYCLLTCLFTLSNTTALAVLRSGLWAYQGQVFFPIHFLMSPMPFTAPGHLIGIQ